jgi:hypothetical protein
VATKQYRVYRNDNKTRLCSCAELSVYETFHSSSIHTETINLNSIAIKSLVIVPDFEIFEGVTTCVATSKKPSRGEPRLRERFAA